MADKPGAGGRISGNHSKGSTEEVGIIFLLFLFLLLFIFKNLQKV